MKSGVLSILAVTFLLSSCNEMQQRSAPATVANANNGSVAGELGAENDIKKEDAQETKGEAHQKRKPVDYGHIMECSTDQVRDAGYFLALSESAEGQYTAKVMAINGWGPSEEIYSGNVVLNIFQENDCSIDISDTDDSTVLKVIESNGDIWLKQLNNQIIKDAEFSHLSCTIADTDLEKICKSTA